MAQQQSNVRERQRLDIDEPKKYNVVFHNDDFTTMELVTEILTKIFRLTFTEAEKIMLTVHHTGRGSVGPYYYDIAVTRKNKAIEIARRYNSPLNLTIEEV